MSKLSKNFSVSEFENSMTATRLGIQNKMSQEHLDNATSLAENVLQKIREHFGPTTITSGYRSPDLNRAIGGSTKSQHSNGEAADLKVGGVSNYEVAKWIMENLEFDQLIGEFFVKGEPNAGWVHVSHKAKGANRKSVLTAVKENGKTEYLKGLMEP